MQHSTKFKMSSNRQLMQCLLQTFSIFCIFSSWFETSFINYPTSFLNSKTFSFLDIDWYFSDYICNILRNFSNTGFIQDIPFFIFYCLTTSSNILSEDYSFFNIVALLLVRDSFQEGFFCCSGSKNWFSFMQSSFSLRNWIKEEALKVFFSLAIRMLQFNSSSQG